MKKYFSLTPLKLLTIIWLVIVIHLISTNDIIFTQMLRIFGKAIAVGLIFLIIDIVLIRISKTKKETIFNEILAVLIILAIYYMQYY